MENGCFLSKCMSTDMEDRLRFLWFLLFSIHKFIRIFFAIQSRERKRKSEGYLSILNPKCFADFQFTSFYAILLFRVIVFSIIISLHLFRIFLFVFVFLVFFFVCWPGNFPSQLVHSIFAQFLSKKVFRNFSNTHTHTFLFGRIRWCWTKWEKEKEKERTKRNGNGLTKEINCEEFFITKFGRYFFFSASLKSLLVKFLMNFFDFWLCLSISSASSSGDLFLGFCVCVFFSQFVLE